MHPGPDPLDTLQLSAPEASWNAGALTIRCTLGDVTELWVTHHGPRALLERVEPRVEPFLPIALLVAGAAGAHLDVAGSVDQTYLSTLRLSYLPLVQSLFGLPPIELRVTGRRPSTRRWAISRRHAQDPAGLMFSGGIDSLYSFIRLRRAQHPLSTLVNINAGAHGFDRALMRRRFSRIQAFADAHDVDAVLVDTNFHEVVRIAHDMCYTIRNIAAAGTLSGAMAGVVESTSRSYYQVNPLHVPLYMCNIAPTITVSLAWSGMPLIEVGYETARWEKLLTIAEMPESHTTLDVCTNGPYQLAAGPGDPINCSTCNKCVWVLLALDKMGLLERYRPVFDLDLFRAGRDESLAAFVERGRSEFASPHEPTAVREPVLRVPPLVRAKG